MFADLSLSMFVHGKVLNLVHWLWIAHTVHSDQILTSCYCPCFTFCVNGYISIADMFVLFDSGVPC